jgi:hypothetical protein
MPLALARNVDQCVRLYGSSTIDPQMVNAELLRLRHVEIDMACDCLACNTDTIFEVKFDRRLEVAARGHESVESPQGSLYKGPIFASVNLPRGRLSGESKDTHC